MQGEILSMQRYIIRIVSWFQGLNPQRRLGLNLMVLAVLLMIYAVLGLLGIVPNPLSHLPQPRG